jgi:dTDP-4-dehydrorhamnose reductase
MPTILVTGGNGQLGRELKNRCQQLPDYEFIFTDIEDLDICNSRAVKEYFQAQAPSYLINCAAYTAVDKAETEKDLAQKVNSSAVKILNDACMQYNARMIHISTDYVFDGLLFRPYREEDTPHPLSVYGKSKLSGEKKLSPFNSIVIRTSWLYSAHGNNFLKTMLRVGKEKGALRVVFDQVGTPTYAGNLADAILSVIKFCQKSTFPHGIYHFSNEGVCSWFDFAREILIKAEVKASLDPIETKEYPTPAQRPYYSVLNKHKIKSTFGIGIPHWQDGLVSCLKDFANGTS